MTREHWRVQNRTGDPITGGLTQGDVDVMHRHPIDGGPEGTDTYRTWVAENDFTRTFDTGVVIPPSQTYSGQRERRIREIVPRPGEDAWTADDVHIDERMIEGD